MKISQLKFNSNINNNSNIYKTYQLNVWIAHQSTSYGT